MHIVLTFALDTRAHNAQSLILFIKLAPVGSGRILAYEALDLSLISR